ncbi:hypothetical protein BGLCM_0022 [Bifidobacterium gallicum DSM 20093 = LMG 11596]|uniref:Uncharacterized protein n=1 Tax=Bifidobacterium gallicum DSM 20093 = LMG 11596 TaxID=561180 RepID=A0A087AMK5_9BIFI|nr:hypothetical protein BGLCM_0022 [Bifidobacterium gallicum DSM 20093 = LMG 11596]
MYRVHGFCALGRVKVSLKFPENPSPPPSTSLPTPFSLSLPSPHNFRPARMRPHPTRQIPFRTPHTSHPAFHLYSTDTLLHFTRPAHSFFPFNRLLQSTPPCPSRGDHPIQSPPLPIRRHSSPTLLLIPFSRPGPRLPSVVPFLPPNRPFSSSSPSLPTAARSSRHLFRSARRPPPSRFSHPPASLSLPLCPFLASFYRPAQHPPHSVGAASDPPDALHTTLAPSGSRLLRHPLMRRSLLLCTALLQVANNTPKIIAISVHLNKSPSKPHQTSRNCVSLTSQMDTCNKYRTSRKNLGAEVASHKMLSIIRSYKDN